MKKLTMTLAAAAAVLALVACGGSSGGTTTVIRETATPTTTSVDPQDAKNQAAADWFAQVAPKQLATLCSTINANPDDALADRLGAKFLGSLILQRGAEVAPTVDLIQAKC